MPDVVVSNAVTHRVQVLVTQLGGYGCRVFTLAELQAQAATVPPTRAGGSRAARHNDLAGCYPDDEEEAQEMIEALEDAIRPGQQRAAAILGEERQKQLLGLSDGGTPNTVSGDLICAGAKRCQEQAVESCRKEGGDTCLVQTLLGIERQRQLLGAGAECGEISMSEVLETCAPDWYGTLTIKISGRYAETETNGPTRIRRTQASDYVLTAQVLSAKVRVNEASIFAPAYTNLNLVLGGRLVASDHLQKVEENFSNTCGGAPETVRRDDWDSTGDEELSDIDCDAILMAPGVSSLFVKPY